MRNQNEDQLRNFMDEVFHFTKNGVEITIFPIVHESLIYSKFATQLITSLNFDKIYLELPSEITEPFKQAIEDLPTISIIYPNEYGAAIKAGNVNRNLFYLIHPGEALFWSAKLAFSNGVPIELIDDSYQKETLINVNMPLTPYQIAAIGWINCLENSLELVSKHWNSPSHLRRSLKMSQNFIKLSDKKTVGQFLLICGGAHLVPIAKSLLINGFECKELQLIQLVEKIDINVHLLQNIKTQVDPLDWTVDQVDTKNIYMYLQEIPFFIEKFVNFHVNFNYFEEIRELYTVSGKSYEEQYEESISVSSYKKMLQYLRNLVFLKFRILPTLLEFIYTAKGIVNDDFAFELFKIATKYPYQSNRDDLFKLPGNHDLKQFIKITFKRRYLKKAANTIIDEDNIDLIPSENYDGEWQNIWEQYSKYGYVSYPPEDEFLESYLNKVRRQIDEAIAEENSYSTKFETSLLDGIDYRETARRFSEGSIYVRKIPHLFGEVGALIVQFVEEPYDNAKFNHHTTLFAEHDAESHLSVVTTKPGEIFVGPGICRVTYAAMVSQFPPVGYPVFINNNNDDFKFRLIETAIKMSLSHLIGFVAPKPPSSAVIQYASSLGYRIIYVPIGKLTKLSLHRLKTMHFLAHRDLRDIAKEYIGF